MASPQLTTGSFTFKAGHEECDETKPDRQHSGIEQGVECPDDCADVGHANKPNRELQILTPSHTLPGRARGSPLVITGELYQDLAPSANTGSIVAPTIFGPVSCLGAVPRLDQPLDVDPSLQHFPPTRDPLSGSRPFLSSISDSRSPSTERQDEDLEDAVSAIHRQPVLDRTVESNALPFVLQGYATWISRLALDPLKLTHITRDFVYSHFEDGDQSRWIVALLANIGSRIGREDFVDATPNAITSVLHSAVRWRLRTAKSRRDLKRSELVSALDSTLGVLAVHFYVDSPIEAMTLRQEAASIFRQLCPEPAGTPVSLSSLLQHPLGCLRQYAGMSILFGVLTDVPTLFRYEIPISESQPNNLCPSSPTIQEDGVVQWLYGIPNHIILLLAKMKEMQQSGLAPNSETVASLERSIREVPPFSGSSSDQFLAVMRSVVHEGWRQAAFVYLYMAVCGDSSDTPRVKNAFKRFMRLLDGIQPGRLPDEFLTSPIILIAPAARRGRDREVIRQRAVVLHRRGRADPTNDSLLCVIEDYWARADAEGRPVVWSDVAVSRRQVLGS
ncbi:unnamed protein product [Rhizoctonia solani]|uniref:Fungal-specific transcription factor domain protein n=1 Tax=Rhizoctonia solani TaxID=456999 RepID=A0A8H3B5T8_9AGAM|nr:unnamed protein product [Rhizoctonia solani]